MTITTDMTTISENIKDIRNSKNILTQIPSFGNEPFTIEDIGLQNLNNGITKKFESTASENATIFKWNFGDDTPIITTYDRIIYHTYTSSGVYLVRHKACSSPICCSNWCSKCIKIYKPTGTGSPGYWKNHPEAWPVNTIIIGNVNYSKDVAIQIMRTPERGDKTYTTFNALISTKLNVMIGNDDSCVASTISAADIWMITYGPVGKRVTGNSYAWNIGEPLYEILDKYNNGLLCAPHRIDETEMKEDEEECEEEKEEKEKEENEDEREEEHLDMKSLNIRSYNVLTYHSSILQKEYAASNDTSIWLGLGLLFGFLFIIDKDYKKNKR